MGKVFISSVMRDFTPQRQAAKAAVESLRQKPVMAEDFGAKPHSSQEACREGVRQSDIYVGVMGRRYGFVTKAGISVTEEEFNEARNRGLPILIFVQQGDPEPQQKEFLARIGAYEEGYFMDYFADSSELQAKVTKALYDYIAQPEVRLLNAGEAASHTARYTARPAAPHATTLGVVLFPARQGETYLSPVDMSRAELKEKLLQTAMFGAGAVLSPTLGTETIEGPSTLRSSKGHSGARPHRSNSMRMAHLCVALRCRKRGDVTYHSSECLSSIRRKCSKTLAGSLCLLPATTED